MALISCPDCGRQVSDRAVSCPGCGYPIAAEFGGGSAAPSSAPAKNAQLEKVDREIILAHLADLRVLELAKYNIEQKLARYANRYNLGPVADMRHLKEALINRVFDIRMAVVKLDPYHGYYGTSNLQLSGQLRQAGLTLPYFYVEENGKRENLTSYLLKYDKTPENLNKVIDEGLADTFPESKTIDKDRVRAKLALQKAYEPNLIPAPYRDVYPIYYLYDYLSTSQESLSDALLHLNLDLIRQRLETVISAQCVSILQQAVTNAKLTSIQDQFDTLIETAKRIEQNTAVSARYDQIAAAHLETLIYLELLQL